MKGLIDWDQCNMVINIFCEVDAQILPFCVMYFCGSFSDLIHFLFPNEDLFPSPFLMGAMHPLSSLLVLFSYGILILLLEFPATVKRNYLAHRKAGTLEI